MSSLVQSMAVPVTEDTPPDLLAGSMDLTVLLPGGRATKASVQRATPMMDLLVQLCTAQRLPPGGHSLQPLGEKGALPYKPSTPIGLLDAWSVRVLPKGAPSALEHPHQLPFQHTFRLQVHLPRNQLLVSRVTPQMGLAAVLKMACEEKNLDPNKYELRHPINLEERLRPELTLGDYGLTEVCVVARDAGGADALALQREQERRRRRAKQQRGGVAPGRQLGAEVGAVTGSVSSGSLGGRSSSPDSAPAVPPPRAPARKRRPAPPPPAANTTTTTTDADADGCSRQAPTAVISKAGSKQVVSLHDGTAPTVTHSRTSSDSSGYHEASVLSDGPDTHPGDKAILPKEMPPPPPTNSTLPRRSKLPPATGAPSAAAPKRTGPTVASSMPLSRSVSNLAAGASGRAVHGDHSSSTSSLSSAGRGPRKKKAAPPPPPPAAAAQPAPRGSAAAPAPARTSAEGRTRPASPAAGSDARRSADIEEEEEAPSPERRPSCGAVAKHHRQQQRSSAELPAEKADLYAKLQRRLPSRGASVTSTSSSGSDDAAAATAGRGSVSEEPAPAPAVRPSRSRDRASAVVRERADVPPQPDVVAVRTEPPPSGSVSSKRSSTLPDEDDPAVDEGIGNDDAAEEVARAFASAAAELEAAILAEDLAAAAAEAGELPGAAYSTCDPPCPTTLAAADPPPRLSPPAEAPALALAVAADGEEWHYEIPAPPSAFRDAAETPPPTPWSYAEGEVRSKVNPLYESGQFVPGTTDTNQKSESPRESTAAVERRNSDRTPVGADETPAEEEVAERERAPTDAERQLRGVLDAKARVLLARPETQLIRGPAADVKDADSETGESSPSDVPDVAEDCPVSQEHHSHSLLNHHHAGQLRHGHHHHHHSHHHHGHHQPDHRHDRHSADAGMPAYLTETIDTLEGFEDLIAVGSGSRPAEERPNTESGGGFDADPAVAAEAGVSASDGERPAAVGEVVESSKSSVTLEMTSATLEGPKEAKTDSTSGNEAPAEMVSGDPAVRSGDVSPRRRSSGEAAVDDGKTRKVEDVRAESDRQRRAQRRRTVEVSGPLVNFTITTYRREIDPDKIFAEAEDAEDSRVSATPAAGGGERRASQVSRSNSVGGSARGSPTGSSRRGGRAEQQPGRSHGHAPSLGVKRSASSVYAALQDVVTREEARARGSAESADKETAGSSQLQSLQVLRSILPQLKTTSQQKESGSDTSDETADTSASIPQPEQVVEDSQKKTEDSRKKTEEAARQPQPYRPPAVSFASWGERPRDRAVSLKVDSDYRVGGAHAQAKQPSQEPQPTDTSATASGSESPTADSGVPEKRVEAAPAGQNALARSGEAPSPAAPEVEPTVIRISTAEPRIRAVQLKAHPPPFGTQPQLQRSDPAALTMRIISHTTAAPFVRQGATSVAVNGAERERVVPVVRAVELKRSALPRQQDGDARDGGGGGGGGGEGGQRFIGVSSLAKRFSFLGDSTVVQRRNSGGVRGARRPVSEVVIASDAASADPGGPVHRAGSFTSLVSASRAGQPGRSDSSDDCRAAGPVPQNGHSTLAVKQMPATFSAAPKGFPLPVVKGFRVPGAGAMEPRKGITLITKPRAGAAVPAPEQNPHEQLMAAIRGFGGTGNLRNQAQNIGECES